MKKGLLIHVLLVSWLLGVFTSNAIYAEPANSTEQTITKVNVNTADAELLANSLIGIGLKKAQAIVDYRKQNGDFKQLEDLAQVKGIGAATLVKNKDKILF